MSLVPVSDLFDVRYGTSLELNALEEVKDGLPFVSRTSQNNGVSARVSPVEGVEPIPGGVLSVALSGNGVMSAFLQATQFYTGYHVAVLSPKTVMTRDQLLFYAACLRANRYRFSYGRQANRTLPGLLVPALTDVPAWVAWRAPNELDNMADTGLPTVNTAPIDTSTWKPFKYTDLFDIVRGKGPSLAEAKDNPGSVPYVTASDKNNGVSAWTAAEAEHPGDCLSVAIDGSVGEVFYQPSAFCGNTAVVALVPHEPITKAALLFIAALIRREGKLKYGYGRKWGLGRMQNSEVMLPVTDTGEPDWDYMSKLVEGLPSYTLSQSSL